MKRLNLGLFVSIISVLPRVVLGQSDSLPPYPSARDVNPEVEARVAARSGTWRMNFAYHVANKEKATQSLWRFFVEVRTQNYAVESPANWHSDTLKRDSITIITWGSEDSVVDIRPSHSLGGFGISSNGLPCIVRSFARGYLEPPEGETEYRKGSNDVFVNSVRGFTIGPADPPLPFVHIAFLDTIISYTRQSAELGWLKPGGTGRDEDCDEDERPEDGTVGNIQKRLQKVHRELEQGDSIRARKELEKFVKKVDRIWKRAEQEEKQGGKKKDKDRLIMTNEAYALLKYNTEYLIEQLAVEEKPRGRK